jgi:prevent-host-death family protein
MITIGIFEAKANLGQLAQSAAEGEVVVLTRRGKPIAEIRPPQKVNRHRPIRCSSLRRCANYGDPVNQTYPRLNYMPSHRHQPATDFTDEASSLGSALSECAIDAATGWHLMNA